MTTATPAVQPLQRLALLYIAVALPPLILAVFGVTHPTDLTAQSAEYWRNLHIAVLPVFPLLGFAPWLVIRGHDAFLSWLVGILGFLYAAFYTALDVLAGIGAGGLKLGGFGEATGTLFHLADRLGFIGSAALIAACAITALATFRRIGVLALPGGLATIVGSFLLLQNHIYFPVGVIGQVLIAAGWAAMVWAVNRPAASTAPVARRAAR